MVFYGTHRRAENLFQIWRSYEFKSQIGLLHRCYSKPWVYLLKYNIKNINAKNKDEKKKFMLGTKFLFWSWNENGVFLFMAPFFQTESFLQV